MKLLILTRKFETPRWFKPSHFLLANLIRFVKFMYSKRATKLDKIHKFYMKLLTSSIVKKRLEISLYYHPYMICRQISTEVCMPILKFKYWMDSDILFFVSILFSLKSLIIPTWQLWKRFQEAFHTCPLSKPWQIGSAMLSKVLNWTKFIDFQHCRHLPKKKKK